MMKKEKMDKETRKISMIIPEELAVRAEKVAQGKMATLSAVVRWALNDYLAKEESCTT